MVRRFRRRRFFRRRRTFRGRSRRMGIRRFSHGYDSIVKQKCIQSVPIVASGTSSSLAIAWGQFGVTDATNAFLDDNLEFIRCIGTFTEFTVRYLKIKVVPISNYQAVTTAGNQAQAFLQEIKFGSAANLAAGASAAVLEGCIDAKSYGTQRPVTRGYNVAKYYKSRTQQWQLNAENDYPDMTTVVRIISGGIPATTEIAKVYITWYVQFRGRVIPGA